MIFIDSYQGRKVFWFDYKNFEIDQLPKENWICFAISEYIPENGDFKKFVRASIKCGILEFKGAGKYGELLHCVFDDILVETEISNKIDFIDITTTGHNDEPLADAFWQCFFATTLPNNADFDNISIVCLDIGGRDRVVELKTYLDKFRKGWTPE